LLKLPTTLPLGEWRERETHTDRKRERERERERVDTCKNIYTYITYIHIL